MRLARIAGRIAGPGAWRAGRAAWLCVVVGSLLGLRPGEVVASSAVQPIRLAVAPFEGERPDLPVAAALSGRLARRSIERLIAPDAFVASARFEPTAEEVRRWAYNAAVEAVVVGRLTARDAGEGETGLQVEAALRSGHSGALLTRHEVLLERPADLGAAVEDLAAALLADLGYVEVAAPEVAPAPGAPPQAGGGAVQAGASSGGAPAIAPPGGQASADPSAGSGDSGGRGLETELDLSSQGDHPIEIKADEAEIIDRDETRELVFRGNVWVRQGNVTLQSDRLEAHYLKGESDPRRLVARGRVRVDQEDRHARCDEATYERETERLSCRGHAQLVQGCDIVRGDSIVFDLAGDRARVEGAASIVIQPEGGEATVCSDSGATS